MGLDLDPVLPLTGFLPFGEGAGDSVGPRSDEGSISLQLRVPVVFYGQEKSLLHVSTLTRDYAGGSILRACTSIAEHKVGLMMPVYVNKGLGAGVIIQTTGEGALPPLFMVKLCICLFLKQNSSATQWHPLYKNVLHKVEKHLRKMYSCMSLVVYNVQPQV